MDRAIAVWLHEMNVELNDPGSLKLPYTIYGCMLLLSTNAFQTPEWQSIRHNHSQKSIERLYELLAKHLKVTHIAVNKPIPLQQADNGEENVVRAPSNFTPLHGNFGPTTCQSPPCQDDFEAAFWVTAKQNGIFQTWAPRWTMFSRGNISEKARLLTLPSVQEAVSHGQIDGIGCAAVDLYAGIGYFAFSYLKAGVDTVLCWDLNPWIIEGLRRGAAANRWPAIVQSEDGNPDSLVDNEARVAIFNESNENASARIKKLVPRLPPIRHVNCGLLPTSRGSWGTALNVLDRTLGGWVHVHENFAVAEIEQRAEEVRATFQHMLEERGKDGTVEIEQINRLKSYAPGVMHCVIDIRISPSIPG